MRGAITGAIFSSVNFPRNVSEQDRALLAVPTEDQEEALQAQQAVIKVMCQEVQDDLISHQNWRDSRGSSGASRIMEGHSSRKGRVE